MGKIVFTNGCFDLLHLGHIDLLERAKNKGTKLIVGINSDNSVKSIKGIDRPFQNQEERKKLLESLRSVDEVRIFDEVTPENLIREIKPDVLIKGGDWKVKEIIGADFVLQNGGEVYSLPLKEGFSSTNIVNKIVESVKENTEKLNEIKSVDSVLEIIVDSISEHKKVFERLVESDFENLKICAELLYETLNNKRKILICGNGGSAADAQHLAAELIGRFEIERLSLPAIALTTDTSALTALANDYNFEKVFSRQVQGLAQEGDCLIAISTSGNSPNVIEAVMEARKKGCRILGLTGADGKKLAALSDVCIKVNHRRTARIQEAHITFIHILCEILDRKFIKNN